MRPAPEKDLAAAEQTRSVAPKTSAVYTFEFQH